MATPDTDRWTVASVRAAAEERLNTSRTTFDYDAHDRAIAAQDAAWRAQGRRRCGRCNGRGTWRGGLITGTCFACDGSGSRPIGGRR